MQKNVLHVGCGTKTIKDMPAGFNDGTWTEVRYDMAEIMKPDILGSMLDMSAVQSGSMDALFSSHNIEHVFTHEVVPVLKEFRRVLKNDGFCVITCPDIEAVCKLVAEGKGLADPVYDSPNGGITAIDILYGHTGFISKGMEFMAHKTGLSSKLLLEYLEKAGFAHVFGHRRPAKLDLWFVAFKKTVAPGVAKKFFELYTEMVTAPPKSHKNK